MSGFMVGSVYFPAPQPWEDIFYYLMIGMLVDIPETKFVPLWLGLLPVAASLAALDPWGHVPENPGSENERHVELT